MKTIISTILVASMLLALSTGAEAKKRQHRNHGAGTTCPINTICYPGNRLPLMLGIGV